MGTITKQNIMQNFRKCWNDNSQWITESQIVGNIFKAGILPHLHNFFRFDSMIHFTLLGIHQNEYFWWNSFSLMFPICFVLQSHCCARFIKKSTRTICKSNKHKLNILLRSIVSLMKKDWKIKMINFVLLHPISCELPSKLH